MSKLRNLSAPFAAALLGLLLSAPAHAVYLEAEDAAGSSIGDLFASFIHQIVSVFAANNGNVIP